MTGQGVPRQRAKGLMWLTLAREASTDACQGPLDRVELYDDAFAAADESDRKLALALLEQYIQSRR